MQQNVPGVSALFMLHMWTIVQHDGPNHLELWLNRQHRSGWWTWIGLPGPHGPQNMSTQLPSSRRDCHSPAPPSPFSSCFNRDGERVSTK